MSCNKCSNHPQKTSTNNQWSGAATTGNLTDHKEKTEFSNEWISTNKTVDAADLERAEGLDLLEY